MDIGSFLYPRIQTRQGARLALVEDSRLDSIKISESPLETLSTCQ
jgi:hypothetical protein